MLIKPTKFWQKESCFLPMCQRHFQTGKLYGTSWKNLKSNGIDDFLILSHNETKESIPYINAEIVEFIDNNCYMNIHTYSSPLEEKQDETIKSYLDIDKLYKASKEKMTKTGMITKQIFETFIHEYQEM